MSAPDFTNPRYQALLELLRAADTLWNASRLFFERWDISPSQFNVLNLLHANDIGLSQTELGRQLIMHRSNVTGLVDRLEKRGLVRRKAVVGDRRAYRVVLTRRADDLLAEILPRYYQRAEKVWDTLSTRRAVDLIAGLRHIAKNANRVTREEEV